MGRFGSGFEEIACIENLFSSSGFAGRVSLHPPSPQSPASMPLPRSSGSMAAELLLCLA
jgi:hypothetical protein